MLALQCSYFEVAASSTPAGAQQKLETRAIPLTPLRYLHPPRSAAAEAMGFRSALRSAGRKLTAPQQAARLSTPCRPSPAPQPTAAPLSAPLSSPSASNSLASAHATTPSAAAPSVPADCHAAQLHSQSLPLPTSLVPASSLFPAMLLVENPDDAKKSTHPLPFYVSLSSDLRLIYAGSATSAPSSLLAFRHPFICLELKRMPNYAPTESSAPPLSLDILLAPNVRREIHPAGPAVRVADKKRRHSSHRV